MSPHDTISSVVDKYDVLAKELARIAKQLEDERAARVVACARNEALILQKHDNAGNALSSIRDTVQRHELRLVVICGEDGKNGKVGNLTEQVAAQWTRISELKRNHFKLVLYIVAAMSGGSAGAIAIIKGLSAIL